MRDRQTTIQATEPAQLPRPLLPLSGKNWMSADRTGTHA